MAIISMSNAVQCNGGSVDQSNSGWHRTEDMDTSLNGVMSATSEETGELIHVEVLTSYCQVCKSRI